VKHSVSTTMFPTPASPPAPQVAPCGLVTYSALTSATNSWAESLGSGSYGAVYAGVLNGERVAVKRFRQKDSGTDSFLREVAVAALVQHPHLLRVVAMVRARQPMIRVPGPSDTPPGSTARA
jgi:hypothetical protein